MINKSGNLKSETAHDRVALVAGGLDRVDDVMEFCKITRSSVYGLISKGLLPVVKIGRSTRIPHDAVLSYAARHLRGGEHEDGTGA